VQGSFLKALAFSLLVHILVLGIPPGRMSTGPGRTEATGRPGPWSVAPLTVDLGPRALELASLSAPAVSTTAAPASTASIVETHGKGKGNRGDEAQVADEFAALPAATLGAPLSVHYYPPAELTRRARILRDVDPYLGNLKNVPGSGKAIIVLWINEHGAVDRVKAEDSTLPEPFEAEIVSQFRLSRFAPAERDGVPAKSLMKVEVEVSPRTRLSGQTGDNRAYQPLPQE